MGTAPAPAMDKAEPAGYTVHFEFDKSELTPDARTMLADVVMAAKKSDYQSIDIGGYTDLMGTDAYNQVLSEQRANAVIEFLVDSGIEAGKIIGRGYGKRSEEHTSELQSLMRISYAVFCLKKKKTNKRQTTTTNNHTRETQYHTQHIQTNE